MDSASCVKIAFTSLELERCTIEIAMTSFFSKLLEDQLHVDEECEENGRELILEFDVDVEEETPGPSTSEMNLWNCVCDSRDRSIVRFPPKGGELGVIAWRDFFRLCRLPLQRPSLAFFICSSESDAWYLLRGSRDSSDPAERNDE